MIINDIFQTKYILDRKTLGSENIKKIFLTKTKKIETTKLIREIILNDCFLNNLSYRCFVFRFSKVQNKWVVSCDPLLKN